MSTTPRPLLAIPSTLEARSLLSGVGIDAARGETPWTLLEGARTDVVVTGVGKANAAGAVARLLDPARHGCLLVAGVAGALPGSGLGLGDLVVGTSSVFADEGVRMPDGFVSMSELGFGLGLGGGIFDGEAVPADGRLLEALGGLGGEFGVRMGPIATLSTGSGTDAGARDVAARTGAIAEAMEGAAACSIALRLGVPSVELRAISNTTGDRSGQAWDVAGALGRLAGALGPAIARLSEVLGR